MKFSKSLFKNTCNCGTFHVFEGRAGRTRIIGDFPRTLLSTMLILDYNF